jgi:O-antigen/teichoic acid export membrane protein
MTALFTRLRHSLDLRDGLLMSLAMFLAGGFDYLSNLVAGRMLLPEQFGIFVALVALLQVVVQGTTVIRNLVAYYSAELHQKPDHTASLSAFFQRSHRQGWLSGGVIALLAALASPALARWLQIDSAIPLLATAPAIVMLFVRPVTDGTLQGLQQFGRLATVQTGQSMLRFLATALLVGIGWQAFGALLAIPLATSAGYLLALRHLRPWWKQRSRQPAPAISLRYSSHTMVGLFAFALLINMDAILVKRLFDPWIAGQYSAVVTLGKINLFVPLALGMVLFPKSVARQSAGQRVRPLLLLSLAATLGSGLVLTLLCFAFPGQVLGLLLGSNYDNPGPVLGLVMLATTLYAGINIWLNYALAVQRPRFVWALALVAAGQAVAISLWHTTLLQVASAMVLAALCANLLAALLLWRHDRPIKEAPEAAQP